MKKYALCTRNYSYLEYFDTIEDARKKIMEAYQNYESYMHGMGDLEISYDEYCDFWITKEIYS